VRREQLAQVGQRGLRRIAEAVEHHHCLDVVVHQLGEHRVLEAADHHRLDDEIVGVAPQLAKAGAHLLPARLLARRHDQRLAVGLARLAAAEDLGQVRLVLVLAGLPRIQVVAVAVRQQGHADALGEAHEAGAVAGLHAYVHLGHQARAGIAAQLLQRLELREKGPCIRLAASRHVLRRAVQLAPALLARLGG
jgi:hypothetical protein